MKGDGSPLKVEIAVCVAVLAIGLGVGFLLGQHQANAVALNSGAPEGVDLSPVWMAWNDIEQDYVPVSVASSTPVATSSPDLKQQEVWGLISGLAASLNDPYSYFLPPTENKQFSSDMSGTFDGVGMEIDEKGGQIVVLSPLIGTPAAAAGIKAGDQILNINGTSTAQMDVETAVSDIRGPAGTKVTLSILRSGWSAPKQFVITRQPINVPEVSTTKLPDGVFVISLAEFTANSPDLFRDALRQFVQSGDSKLIIDLRENPGGYLDAAVDIGSYFLPSGDTIVTEDYDGHQQNIVHKSFGYDIFNSNLKVVVLVDGGTASAAEILSSALRFYGVAQLVGNTTYGKGSVQELIPITSDTNLKLTVARWLTPSGSPIPSSGIIPDVQVSLSTTTTTDLQMLKAVQLLGGTSATGTPQIVN